MILGRWGGSLCDIVKSERREKNQFFYYTVCFYIFSSVLFRASKLKMVYSYSQMIKANQLFDINIYIKFNTKIYCKANAFKVF